MKPKALRLIEEVKKIVPIAIIELDSGKIYSGVLEKQLRLLAELTQKELKDIKKHLTDKQLISECEAIYRESKTAWKIIKEYENKGLTKEQETRIRRLLDDIMGLETVVEKQTQNDMSRREFVRQSAFGSLGAFLFGGQTQLPYQSGMDSENRLFNYLNNSENPKETYSIEIDNYVKERVAKISLDPSQNYKLETVTRKDGSKVSRVIGMVSVIDQSFALNYFYEVIVKGRISDLSRKPGFIIFMEKYNSAIQKYKLISDTPRSLFDERDLPRKIP